MAQVARGSKQTDGIAMSMFSWGVNSKNSKLKLPVFRLNWSEAGTSPSASNLRRAWEK